MAALETALEPQRLQKSPSAFRTISEVSSELDVPQHVLRFWETKFAQLRPLKRGGGRRYYRPEDVHLLFRIRELLYRDGYTIKGVQRLFRTDGIKGLEGAEPLHGAQPRRGAEPIRSALAEVMEAEALAPIHTSPGHSDPGSEPLDRRAELESVLQDLLDIRALLRAAPEQD